MRSPSKRRGWTSFCCLLATLLLAFGFAPSVTRAAKPSSIDFLIKGEYDGSAASNVGSYVASGAIEDAGTYDVEVYWDWEYFEYWYRFKFESLEGTFYVGWIPGESRCDYIESRVEYPVELMPGTGAYANVQGTGTFKMHAKNVYEWPGNGSKRSDCPEYRIESITIKGSLSP